MHTRRASLALAMAMALTAVSAASVAAAPSGGCDSGDKLVAVTGATASYDLNANGSVCAHTEHYHAPKKPGPPATSVTYYDDAA